MVTPEEQMFLKRLAIERYNLQFGTNLDPKDFLIFSIHPNINIDLGYELRTVWNDDYLRLRMYLNFNSTSNLSEYHLEVDQSDRIGSLEDEVFVTLGTILLYYKESGMYSFGWIPKPEEVPVNLLLTEDFYPILTEAGEYILYENI